MYHNPADTAEFLYLKYEDVDKAIQACSNNKYINKNKNQERFDFWCCVLSELRAINIKNKI
jgi:hypothetical protein